MILVHLFRSYERILEPPIAALLLPFYAALKPDAADDAVRRDKLATQAVRAGNYGRALGF